MSEMDKELLEQIELIRKDAESIEVSDGISFDNMMRRLEATEDKGKVCDFEESKYKVNKGNKLRKNWVAICTGIAGTVAAAVLLVTLLIGDIGKVARVGNTVGDNIENSTGDSSSNGNVNVTGPLSSYAEKMKVEAGNGIYVLSGYKELDEYLDASEELQRLSGLYWDELYIYETLPEGETGAATDGDVVIGDFDDGNIEVDENTGSETDHSDTNVRTEGVGEADIVKTDGQYIYYIGYKENECEDVSYIGLLDQIVYLSICKADGADSESISEINIVNDVVSALEKLEAYEDTIGKMYMNISNMELVICGDKLIVVSTPSVSRVYGNGNGYTEYQHMNNHTVVLTYDIADKTNPKLYSSMTLEGTYNSCKVVDGYVYIFATLYKNVSRTSEEWTEEVAAGVYAPMVCGKLLPADDVYVADGTNYNLYNIIAVMDSTDMSQFYDVKAVIGANGSIERYVTGENMYFISAIGYDYLNIAQYGKVDETIEMPYKSQIMRFSYDKGNITPTGCTYINGDIGDEFDIDEYNGYLRMAVSAKYCDMSYHHVYEEGETGAYADIALGAYSYKYITTRAKSALYILDGDLQMVGSIPELQSEEEVYGVRFDGDVAYIVTYRQTDPLFTVDLSDPTNPTVMSALKIPGFSTYIHKWDEGKLIGLGYDEYGQIKISTFDITDKYDVKEVEVCTLDNSYYSEALYDHKGVFISPEKNLIGFGAEGYIIDPVSGDGSFSMMYNIYSYIEGKLTQVICCDTGYGYYDMRGLYIGEYIYIVHPINGVYVYNMADYSQVAQVQ